jgi:DNA-binding LytR/AlgR family response regulator
MKKINCVVADDEQLARGIIEDYIHSVDRLQLVASCSNGTAVYNALKTHPVDLLFLDIRMPQLTGIELLRTLNHPPPVVLTTAYREFALEGYELNVIDYLLKPISFERFLKAVDKFESIRNPGAIAPDTGPAHGTLQDRPAFIYVKSDKKMIRILLGDILFVEGLKDYVRICTVDKAVITYQTLSYFEQRLPANRFVRVHRSYIISLDHITAYSQTLIEIGKESIPIGSSYSKEVLKKLTPD